MDFKVAKPLTRQQREWQIDCDWTAKSKSNYFTFLKSIRQVLPPQATLSATVRLHQFRDQSTQGIPPVDKGLLMAYNVGELGDWNTENSQIDTNITSNYLKAGTKYPLPLDIALPYFEWGVVFREGQLAFLINGLQSVDLADTTRFAHLSPNRFQVVTATYFQGKYLYQGDLIRLEQPEEVMLNTLAKQLQIIPTFTGQRMLFYRLGSKQAQNCNIDALMDIRRRIWNN